MSIKATTEPMFFPGSGTWRNMPINTGFGTPGIIDYFPGGPGETRPFEPPLNNFPLAGRFGLIAEVPKKLTPVQAAAKNFGDLPFIGPLINTIRDYEDRINYRNADPETRRLLGLE